MNIKLPYELENQIQVASDVLKIKPAALIEIFVKDGLSLYNDCPDEFRTTIIPEVNLDSQPEANS